MARARNIKPKFFQNEELAEISPLGRLLFIGLWTICDFRGCLEYRPKRIRAQLLPYDECDAESLLINLEKSGFIQSYTVRGQRYIKIATFERHQTPHKNERDAGSEIPDITEKDREINELKQVETNPEKDGTARAESLFPLPSSPTLNPSSGFPNPEIGTPRNTNVERRAAPPDVDKVEAIFDYWKRVMESPRSQLDNKRKKAINAALKQYDPRQLCEAILGCFKSDYHMARGEHMARGTKYNGLGLIFRDADHIDRFIALAGVRSTGPESMEERNARIIAEFLRDGTPEDGDNVIDIYMQETEHAG